MLTISDRLVTLVLFTTLAFTHLSDVEGQEQHLADVFFQLGEIPKQIRVEDAVVFNAPWWTRELAGQ
jgi:hypothetical protein